MPWETDWPNTPIENLATENQENIIKLLINKQNLNGIDGKVEIWVGLNVDYVALLMKIQNII